MRRRSEPIKRPKSKAAGIPAAFFRVPPRSSRRSSADYFLRRLSMPVAKEPRPSRPSSGNGDAVWGSLFFALSVPEAFWSEAAFCSDAALWLEALWSAAADWSELVAGAADWSAAALLLEAAELWSALVAGEAAAVWSPAAAFDCEDWPAIELADCEESGTDAGCEYEGWLLVAVLFALAAF